MTKKGVVDWWVSVVASSRGFVSRFVVFVGMLVSVSTGSVAVTSHYTKVALQESRQRVL